MDFFSKHKVLFVALVASAVLLGGGYSVFQIRQSSFELVPVRRAPIKEVIYGIGTVQARHRFSFKVGVTKTIARLNVREGDSVHKGDLILVLDDGVTVRTPIDGTVTALPYFAGENIFPDQPAVIIEDLKDRYITATLEQQGAMRVRRGMSVNMSFESLRGDVFHGKIQAVFPKAGQFIAQIEATALPPEVIPAMTADVGIEVAEKPSALLVPLRSLSGGRVTIQRDGKKIKIPIQTGSMDQEWVEVVSGSLSDSDQVVVPRR